MHNRLRALAAFLVLMTLAGVTRADPAPRLKASWKEKDARVELFSPDGRTLVSSGGEGFRLRDAGTGKDLAVLATSPVGLNGAAFSPDGRFLFAKVSSERHKPVWVDDLKVWVVATGQEYATFPYVAEGRNVATEHYAVSGDGKTLAFLDHSEKLPIEVKSVKSTFILGGQEHTSYYNASKGLPRVTIWDVPGWKKRAIIDGGAPLVFSPDGTVLVTGARDWHDPTAKVWDVATGRRRAEFDSREMWMKPLVFSPDGKFLAIGTSRKQELYELASGRRWSVPESGNWDEAPVFSPDGRLLFPGGFPRRNPLEQLAGALSCYDLASLPPKRLGLESGVPVISPDLSRYAAVQGESGTGGPLTVVLHDLPSSRETGRLEVPRLAQVGFSPDGRWLALMVGRHEAVPPGPETRYLLEIQLVDPATARVIFTIPSPGQTWGNYGWKFSPDGRSIAVDYRTGSNVSRDGEPDPIDRPMTLEVWELPAP